ncbi:Eco57I restriction-modification methylase domain-containing protein [Arcobacter porcinus]|uniref:site-specific DNA-methyltransferase (adenine-specific) n=1 Tax=Arcobacter porcinus TaxID=1935204 RepID=A0A5C2HJI0_9BACT|nr:class I SAM-dependent DNA methyltransferase [Arcobacter porcinus]OCL89410.1 hypothetical protein AAX27_01941 [Aliarcobacter thereius]QEP40448.1 type IIG restriction/modification system [Arcobacter porcinus]
MNLIGIVNENEFYTNHYLSEIFQKDTNEQISFWQEKENESQNYKTPFRRLRGIGHNYLELLKILGKTNINIEEKIKAQREFMKTFLDIFEYEFKEQSIQIDDFSLPLISSINKNDGLPYLYILESFCEDECDILTTTLKKEQLKELDIYNSELNFDEIITSHIFTQNFPPRWVIVINAYQIVLIERAKWAQKRYLRFDLKDIIERKEDDTLKAISVLLHSSTIAPTDGLSLLDTLDENSHKHAFGVTEDLKYSLRNAVELLGNEAIFYYKQNSIDILNKADLDSFLTRESLRYMYRLLFLFYIESRPELGFIPSKSQAFIKGYSLETLRDLELMPLLTDSDKNGYFFDESIRLYFDMIFNGAEDKGTVWSGRKKAFSIAPLKSHLFDPEKTPLLNEVKLRNHIWQEIIQSLSLSKEQKGRNQRGRISYANLGINQLGAVYEALLSYKGFIAKEELFEVKKEDSNPTELENAYFVTQSQLSEYTQSERVFDGNGTLKRYKEGTFIYRLAGRDREKSASYYTPEVLTKSLVKYALKELLEIDDSGKIGKSADEILKLTVCEPAMGSAAFLNEAINQLSIAYLHQKQIETNTKISHDKYTEELQRVKMYIADNNVYGIDLNPTAVELAEISLWLNAMFTWEEDKVRKTFIPWFGFQLENGNSLIGARREVYDISTLSASKKDLLWYKDSPKRLNPKTLWKTEKRDTTQAQNTASLFEDTQRLPHKLPHTISDTKNAGREKEKEVYHFLLGDEGMSNYTDKVVKELKKEKIDIINSWRKEFIKPYTKDEIDTLLDLSLAIDNLWQEHTRHINDMKKKTTDPLKVWGQPKAEQFKQTDLSYKNRVFEQEKLTQNIKSSSPYIRLKTVMNYWCSLWFWSIDKAEYLPTREEFLSDIAILVKKQSAMMMNLDKILFSPTIDDDIRATQLSELGVLDVEEFIQNSPRLQIVKEISQNQKFLHWELEFADIFAKNGGFDMVLGNPPWLKVEWNEGGIMGEANPLFDIRKFSASRLNSLRSETFEKSFKLINSYIDEYISISSYQNFLNSNSNYKILEGSATNLYKNFIIKSFNILNNNGISGLLHPEGIYEDPRGNLLRSNIYLRLKYHMQFVNKLLLFEDIHDQIKYSINIYKNKISEIFFYNISNLYHPITIDNCFNDINKENIEEQKINGKWNINGNIKRVIKIDKNILKIFSVLYDENIEYNQARLPSLQTNSLLSVIEKIGLYKNKIISKKDNFNFTFFWDENKDVLLNNIINKTSFLSNINNKIIQGSFLYVGNPFYKIPRNICTQNSHYDILDLDNLDIRYIGRTNYLTNKKFQINSSYRLAYRKMINSSNERTLISAIYPSKVSHTSSIISFEFNENKILLSISTFSFSIISDFYVKTTGMANFGFNIFKNFPLINLNKEMLIRCIILSVLTTDYKELWEEEYSGDFRDDSWSKKDDSRLNQDFFKNLTPYWQRDVALRSDYERRQALVEIDVLVAIELGLSLQELKTIYRIQFPVLKQNENETFYDANGRIVFTVSKGLVGVGLPRKADKNSTACKIVINGKIVDEKPLGWEDIMDMSEGEIHRTILDDTTPAGVVERTIVYKAPFVKCDREKDYEIAWECFEKQGVLND